MRYSTRTIVTTGALALALGLAGCGGGGGETPSGEETPLGPLDEYFEQIYGSWDEDTANAQQMQVEEVVAECMAEEGFEYIPVDYSSMGGGYSPDELDVEWGTLEFAEQYGYGATTNPWGDEAAEPAPEEEWVDPNQDYVMAMSETEQQAYYAALYGNQEYVEGEETEYDWTTAGCQGRAQHEVYEVGSGMDEDSFTALQEEMSAMWETIATDPRVTGLDAEWASCMADAGYDGLAAVGDAENQFYEQVNAVYEDAYENTDDSTDYEALDAEVQEQLSALTDEEIATAVADFTCREEVRYTEIQQEVNIEYQEEFVAAHKAELDAWAAAAQAAQG